MPFASPVLYFGNIKQAKIATLGINPSNKEFVDDNNNEIVGEFRRFHTLNSLKLSQWEELENDGYTKIIESFDKYFTINPYNSWFKQLDYLLSGTMHSYYFPYNNLVHLDLTPVATFDKWSDIPRQSQKKLLDKGAIILKELINNSSIDTLVLNGQYVLKNIELFTNSMSSPEHKPCWDLPRKGRFIKGYAYEFEINKITRFPLNRTIRVLGYNYNIQSNFGVTNEIRDNIRNWLIKKII